MPLFHDDTTAALRAAEMGCDVILKATQVDGIYSDDPKRNPEATRFDRLTYDQALAKDLKVMDAAAFALARDAKSRSSFFLPANREVSRECCAASKLQPSLQRNEQVSNS